MTWILEFIVRRPRLLLAIGLAALVVSAWLTFQHVVHQRDEAESALAVSRLEVKTLEQRVQMAQRAAAGREVTRIVERRVVVAVEAAEEDIANAQDVHEFYTAWVAGVISVRDLTDPSRSGDTPAGGVDGSLPQVGLAFGGEPAPGAIASAPILWREGRAAGGFDYENLSAA